MLAGSDAEAAWPERAPVIPGVAFLEGAAAAMRTDAAFLVLVPETVPGVAVRPVGGGCPEADAALASASGAPFGSSGGVCMASAAGVALTRAFVSAGGAARPFALAFFAAPAAPAAPARGDLFTAFPAGARGAT